MAKLRTIEEVRNFFSSSGNTVINWAKQNGVQPYTVYEVLRGNRKCLRGETYKVAVLLGLKDGVIANDEG